MPGSPEQGVVGLLDMQRSTMPIDDVSKELHEEEPAAPASDEKSADASEPVFVDKSSDSDPMPELPIPRWLLNLIGHVLAALLGLILGYLILACRYPLRFPLPWYH
jgi:hypothetical protein